ncbi:MAG: alpha/beta fold hydrolase [Acidimicrobiales bacterium]
MTTPDPMDDFDTTPPDGDWAGYVAIDPDISMWVERIGDSAHGRTPVLLLSEAEAPSHRWPEPLIDSLVAELGSVIRFDTRDSGRSSWVEPLYGLDDLATDAVAVLDALGVDRAHVVGRSMGGMVAQIVAIVHPERVASLTLISTTPGPDEALGPPEQWLVDHMAERLFAAEPTDPTERVEWLVEQQRWFAGPRFPFEEDRVMAAAVVEVSDFWRGKAGHGAAVVEAGSRMSQLGSVDVPTLVVHGTADPVHPVAHGQALAGAISGARLELVDGLGHELPAAFAPRLVDLIARLARGG